MSQPLEGKVALVTGAATGIGKAIAATLAIDGAQVVLNHPHTPHTAAVVVKEIEAAGGHAPSSSSPMSWPRSSAGAASPA